MITMAIVLFFLSYVFHFLCHESEKYWALFGVAVYSCLLLGLVLIFMKIT
jgi:hypothetical protein